ncbi:hypothetical protein [Halobaculum roseum]|uniref:DUF8215 domain-containing protein n=1 Tax=Halobaculum roseum TaxID=2175149 RepID=A0ABD5MJT5_9EURY|nr:hypothetical protein [Halobaculum roseum]QZY03472.1 hypothetical protein K6T36_04690 [Halobaculum roseum]
MGSRGTDESTERRKLRPRERTDALGRFLEDTFDALGEHALIAVPSLLWAALSVPPGDSTAMLAGYVALVVGLAVVRGNRLSGGDGRRGIPPWPDGSRRPLLARVGYYNLAIVAIAALATAGAPPGWGESAVSLTVAGTLGLALGLGFPVVAAAVVRLTGGGPRARPQDWNSLRADRERNRRSR